MIATLYYYYYLFYKKILRDNEPHLLATLVLAFSCSLFIIGIIDITIAHLLGVKLGRYTMLGISLFMILVFYLTLHKTGKAKKIIENKPMFFHCHLLSIILTFLFFAFTTSYLFWGSGYVGGIVGTR